MPPAPAESLKKESSEVEPRGALKLVVDWYGTTPRKYLPPATLPVIARLPRVSIGLGLLNKRSPVPPSEPIPEPIGFLTGSLRLHPALQKKATCISGMGLMKYLPRR